MCTKLYNISVVSGPPVMSPFNFPPNLQEGSRAQVTCSVTSGDLPIYFSWLKDGEPLPSSLRVSPQFNKYDTVEKPQKFENIQTMKEEERIYKNIQWASPI